MGIDKARAVLINAYGVARMITGHDDDFHPSGSAWVWEGRDPEPGGSWHLFGVQCPIDPNASLYLDPAKVDRSRHEVEILMNAFPATERRLEDLGCNHLELLHKRVSSSDDALLWSCSIFNACTPLPRGWHIGPSDEKGPGMRDWPWHAFSIAQLVPEGFFAVQGDAEGRIAVLPVNENCTVIYWAEPGSRYDEEAKKAASKGLDYVLGPRHPVSLAAYHGKWTGNRLKEESRV